eukprot:m.191028 g.191028  ORF g.191028 m.191028 type:complete len:495 (+) comp39439_c2_seq22:69-1553(+)
MSSRVTFAALLGAFQLLFLVLFGVFVEYGREPGGFAQTPVSNQSSTLRKPTRNYIDDYYGVFQDVHVMIFVGFGFLMTFLKRYSFSSIGVNFLIAAFVIQWATLVNGFFSLAPDGFEKDLEIDIQSLILSDFAAGAVLITFGAVIGKVSPTQMLVIAFLEIIFYGLNVMIGEHYFKAVDIGGSMFIHTFGAYFGISLAGVLDKKQARKGQEKESSVYHSDLFAMIGTLFLWMFWPSFNGALATASIRHRAVINTYFSLAASVASAFIFSQLLNKRGKFEMVHVQNATLAGGVAIGNAADLMIGAWGAMLVGFMAGFISVIGYTYIQPWILKKFRIHDTCGVHNLHGMPGVFGAIVAIITISTVSDEKYGSNLYVIFGARAPAEENKAALDDLNNAGWGIQTGEGRSASAQAAYQLATLGVTLGLAVIGGLLTGAVAKLPGLNSVPDKDGQLFEDERNWEVPEELTFDLDERIGREGHEQGKAMTVDLRVTQSSV